MKDESRELLMELSRAHAVPGFEDEVRSIMAGHLAGSGECRVDRMGNLRCEIGSGGERPRVLVDSHMDEVGFMVQSITPDGFLRLVELGAWSMLTLSAQPLVVLGSRGKVPGVVGSVPPHFARGKGGGGEAVPQIADFYMDIGAKSAREAMEWGVSPGCGVCPDVEPRLMGAGCRLLGKAWDNRVGCAAAVEVGKAFGGTGHNLVVVGSVQEEGGLRGAEINRGIAGVDLVIVMEGSPADDTPGLLSSGSQGVLGAGVQIRHYDPTHLANPRLVRWAQEVASREGIPWQAAVRRTGGTNAGKYHLGGSGGIPTLVLAPPVRYIHSHLGVVELADYEAMRELAVALVRELTWEVYAQLLPAL